MWCPLIKLYQGSSCVDTGLKLLIFGRGLYPLNMGRVKGVRALKFVGELMGAVCG